MPCDLRTAKTVTEGTDNRTQTTGLVLPKIYLPARVRARTLDASWGPVSQHPRGQGLTKGQDGRGQSARQRTTFTARDVYVSKVKKKDNVYKWVWRHKNEHLIMWSCKCTVQQTERPGDINTSVVLSQLSIFAHDEETGNITH